MAEGTRARRSGLNAVVLVCGTALIYGGAARLALLMAIPPGYATAVWPAAGLGLICVLAWGWPASVGVAIGSCLVNLGTTFDGSSAPGIARSFAIAGGIGIGACVQTTLGAVLIRRRIGFPNALHEERHIVWFTVLGGPVACLASATIGVTTLAASGVVEWTGLAFSWWTWWIGDTIGVLVFAPLALLALPARDGAWRRRRGMVGIPLVLGFVVVAMLFVRVSAWERTRLQRDFERRAAPVEAVLRAQLSQYEEVVRSLASYFDVAPDVRRSDFEVFCARALAKHPAISALTWNPWVPAVQRAEVEARARADGVPGYQFRERGPDGGLREVSPRASYVPVVFVEPTSTNAIALGFDTASDEVRRGALDRARSPGDLTATPRIELVQDTVGAASASAVLLMAPVFSRGDAPALRGYAIGAFRLRDLIEVALRGVDHDGMVVRLVDQTMPGSVSPLYDGVWGGEVSAATPLTFAIGFGDRRWQLAIAPTDVLLASQRGWQAWTVLAAGLLFVGLLGVVLLVTTGRTFRTHEGAERFRALVEASAQIVWTTNAAGEVTEDSPSWRAFTGQTFEQWRGWGRLDVVHPDDREMLARRWCEAVAGAKPIEMEYRLRHVSGEWRWTAVRAVPLTDPRERSAGGGDPVGCAGGARHGIDPRGGLRGWVMSNTDITERKRAADQFRVAIDAAPTGMVMVDRHGRIALANSQIEKLLGYTHGELTGKPIELLVPTGARGHHPEQRDGFFHSPRPRPMGGGREVYAVRKDGLEVPIEIGLNPLRAADQDYVLCSVVDITDKKRAEAERSSFLDQLTRLNAELEQRVQARTSELTASLREREVLLQEVHHRVKNNLQVISSLMNMQVRKIDRPADREALEECQTRVQAIALIHEKLYQSRDYAHVPFSEYTRTLVSSVFHTMGVAAGTVALDMAIEDVAVPVDKAIPCGLVLNELITNALKHAFKDGRRGQLRVELGRRGDRMRLAVMDNGVGLPPGLDVRGSGSFGLQLVMTLVEQLEAKLAVTDRGGACFELDFAVEN